MGATTAAEEYPFEPITRETVSSQIRSQLLDRITTGELAPGARMPSERDLSERFNVARTSVREAMQGLVSTGVVERRGNRSYVAEHLPDVVVAPAGDQKSFVAELFETRRVLEVPLFELAAQRACPEDRARVTALAGRFDESLEVTEFRRLDREFHTKIAACSANPLLIELYGKVLDQLFRSDQFSTLLSSAHDQGEVARIIADSALAHRSIASAFASADAAAVRAAVEVHLDEVEHSVVSGLA